MSRRLIVLRHAKSAWNTNAASDHARPLNKRGRRDAPRVGARLREVGWAPQHVLCSDALRTRQTWELMRGAFEEASLEVAYSADLYHAALHDVAPKLAELHDTVHTVMVIGHNPGWEELTELLSGMPERLTTCNAALLSCEVDDWCWSAAVSDMRVGRWRLEAVVRPKEL